MDYAAAVIGGGPGGLVAALYLKRYLRSTILVSSGSPRASWIPKTHNLLGFRAGISGQEILQRLHGQLDDLGLERCEADAKVFPLPRRGFRVDCGDRALTAEHVILATGISDVQPNLKNLARLRKRGLLRYCPVCDAYEFRDEKILVLAQDAHGFRTASFVAGFSNRVHVLWPPTQRLPAHMKRTHEFKGANILVGNLEEMWETEEGALEVKFTDERKRTRTTIFDACYVALGSTVNDSAFRHLKLIEREEGGCIIVDHHQQTGQPGLYAVGDCVRGLAQIAVAAGQAAIAATHIHNQLRARENQNAHRVVGVRESERELS